MAGVSGMPARCFLPANAVASLIWTLVIGLGSYLAGPAVADALGDVGAGLVALIALVVISGYVRRRMHRRWRPYVVQASFRLSQADCRCAVWR
jgi:membrane protein DedA with SNARE-associated domain